MNNRETLIHAAELLEREAAVIHRSYMRYDGEWDDVEAGEMHDDMLQTARALRGMAEES